MSDSDIICPIKDPHCDNFFRFYWYLLAVPVQIFLGIMGNGSSLLVLVRLNSKYENYFSLLWSCVCNFLLCLFFIVWPCLETYGEYSSYFAFRKYLKPLSETLRDVLAPRLFKNEIYLWTEYWCKCKSLTTFVKFVKGNYKVSTPIFYESLDTNLRKLNFHIEFNKTNQDLPLNLNFNHNQNLCESIMINLSHNFSTPIINLYAKNLYHSYEFYRTYNWNIYSSFLNSILLNTLSRTSIIFMVLFLCDRYVALVLPHLYYRATAKFNLSSEIYQRFTSFKSSKSVKARFNQAPKDGNNTNDKSKKGTENDLLGTFKQSEKFKINIENKIFRISNKKNRKDVSCYENYSQAGAYIKSDENLKSDQNISGLKMTTKSLLAIFIMDAKLLKYSPFILVIVSSSLNIYTFKWSEVNPCKTWFTGKPGYYITRMASYRWQSRLFIMDIFEELILAIFPTLFIIYLVVGMIMSMKKFRKSAKLRRNKTCKDNSIGVVEVNNNSQIYGNTSKALFRPRDFQNYERATGSDGNSKFLGHCSKGILIDSKNLEPNQHPNPRINGGSRGHNYPSIFLFIKNIRNKVLYFLYDNNNISLKFTIIVGLYFFLVLSNSIMSPFKSKYAARCRHKPCILFDYLEPIFNWLENWAYVFFFYAYWFLDKNFRVEYINFWGRYITSCRKWAIDGENLDSRLDNLKNDINVIEVKTSTAMYSCHQTVSNKMNVHNQGRIKFLPKMFQNKKNRVCSNEVTIE
ncbi:unnamed protein product [Gordionus sp. m RMFG-2023]